MTFLEPSSALSTTCSSTAPVTSNFDELTLIHNRMLMVKAKCRKEIRRFQVHSTAANFNDLSHKLHLLFGSLLSTNVDDMTLKYRDEDGDEVSLDNDEDLRCAIMSKGDLVLHVYDKTQCSTASQHDNVNLYLNDLVESLNKARIQIDTLLEAVSTTLRPKDTSLIQDNSTVDAAANETKKMGLTSDDIKQFLNSEDEPKLAPTPDKSVKTNPDASSAHAVAPYPPSHDAAAYAPSSRHSGYYAHPNETPFSSFSSQSRMQQPTADAFQSSYMPSGGQMRQPNAYNLHQPVRQFQNSTHQQHPPHGLPQQPGRPPVQGSQHNFDRTGGLPSPQVTHYNSYPLHPSPSVGGMAATYDTTSSTAALVVGNPSMPALPPKAPVSQLAQQLETQQHLHQLLGQTKQN